MISSKNLYGLTKTRQYKATLFFFVLLVSSFYSINVFASDTCGFFLRANSTSQKQFERFHSLLSKKFSEEDASQLAELLFQPQPLSTLLRVSANRTIGMSLRSAVEMRHSFHPQFKTVEQIRNYFNADILNYSASVTGGDFISAQYSVFPVAFFNQPLIAELGIPQNALIFNMNLSDAEIHSHFKEQFQKFKFPHIQDSMGYIRFYLQGHDVIVTEIQSELYKQISNVELKKNYKIWSKQLLFAFENYVREVIFSQFTDGEGRILIAGADYQLRRWRAQQNKLSPDLARILYRDFPRQLGYSKGDINYAFEWPGHISSEEAEIPEEIQDGSILSQQSLAGSTNPLRVLYTSFENRMRSSRWSTQFDLLHSLREEAQDISDQFEIKHLSSSIIKQNSFIIPYDALPARYLYLGNLKLQSFHNQLLHKLPNWTSGLVDRTLISRGTADQYETLEEELEINGQLYLFQQWVGSDRHPTLQPNLNSSLTVAFKGGGRRTFKDEAELRPQIFAEKESEVESHRVQGGLLESHGLLEFRNHLHLLELGDKIGLSPSIAIPLDVGWMKQIPRFIKDKIEMLSLNQFIQKELATAPERIVQFRSVVKSRYRVLAIMQMLNTPTFLFLAKSLLEDIYKIHGEKLKWGDTVEQINNSDGSVNHEKAFRFLHEIYKMNQDAGSKILSEFARSTLETIGFVHGLGGHFGGTATSFLEGPNGEVLLTDKSLGAPSGGATQFRNVTLAGELRDLDSNVYIPGVPGSFWEKETEILKFNLEWFQAQDLRHWQETWYWVNALLKGKIDPPVGIKFPDFIFGDPSLDSELVVRRVVNTPEGRLQTQYLADDLKENRVLHLRRGSLENTFAVFELQKIYEDAFIKGARLKSTSPQ